MRRWIAPIAALWLAGCAQLPPPASPEPLLRDELFASPSQPIDVAGVFAISRPMQDYLRAEIAPRVRERGRQGGLVLALYQRGQLRLDYDTTVTRTAGEAFDARAGNCLSLVIMTAAFAKALDLTIEYNAALNVESWTRNGDLYVHSGHVNLTLGHRRLDRTGGLLSPSLTIDFLPQEDITGMRSRAIGERTVLAMYMNNRAAELLAGGRLDDAYWHAREAVRQDPGFASAFNTLGVIYLRQHAQAEAEAAFRRALGADPDNPRVLTNLAATVERQGRAGDAIALRDRLARIEPDPPYHYFHLGMAAAEQGRWAEARDLFRREVRRADFNPEFHHWLAVANWQLGDLDAARRELALAARNSTTGADRDRYIAKRAQLTDPASATR